MKYKTQVLNSTKLNLAPSFKLGLSLIKSFVWMLVLIIWLVSSAQYDWIYLGQIAPAAFIITMVFLLRDFSDNSSN